MTHLTSTQTSALAAELVIRRGTEQDAAALARLAALDSAKPLRGEALIAFVHGEPWAAISLEDGRVVADPFRPSSTAAELVRLRAAHLRAGSATAGNAHTALRLRRASA